MTPKGILAFPRKHQGDSDYFKLLQKASFTTGYAFFEMLGEVISPSKEVISIFDPINNLEDQIIQLYKAASLL